MSRFNKGGVPTVGPKSTISSTGETVTNFAGGTGHLRDAKSELFLLAVSFMGGDDNFYEKESARYDRLLSLLNEESVYADMKWLYPFVEWVRDEANMRTVAMVIAVESVLVRLAHSLTDPVDLDGGYSPPVGNKDLVSVALSRADEPAETLAYWNAKHGGLMPQPIKNGIGDAAVRLYNEFSYIKYGNPSGAVVTAREVLRMTHPKPKNDKQNGLFNYIVGKSEIVGPETLPVLHARKVFYSVPVANRLEWIREAGPRSLANAGITWEALSEWSPEGMTGRAWDLIIPNMGVMALIRNLNNFDQAGISRESVRFIQDKLSDGAEILKSRVLPFRFYQAFRSVESVRWSDALDIALNYSLSNIPKFDGHTLVLIDRSGSMFLSKVSPKSAVTYAEIASLFGAAIKIRNPGGVDLYQYGSRFPGNGYVDHSGRGFTQYAVSERWNGVSKVVKASPGASMLTVMDKFQDMGGTETHRAVAETMEINGGGYDRVIIVTDEQAWDAPNYDELPIPPNTNVFIWNLGGYQAGITKSGKYHRHTFGGLNDRSFGMIPILEAGRNSGWTWENTAQERDSVTEAKRS